MSVLFLISNDPAYHFDDGVWTSSVSIPEGTIGVDVPMDPALAIYHRLDRMIKVKK